MSILRYIDQVLDRGCAARGAPRPKRAPLVVRPVPARGLLQAPRPVRNPTPLGAAEPRLKRHSRTSFKVANYAHKNAQLWLVHEGGWWHLRKNSAQGDYLAHAETRDELVHKLASGGVAGVRRSKPRGSR